MILLIFDPLKGVYMKQTTAVAVAALASLFILGGCDSTAPSNEVTPRTTTPTGDVPTLKREITNFRDENSSLAQSIQVLSDASFSSVANQSGFDGDSKHLRTADTNSCVDNGITRGDDNRSMNGTITFSNCNFDGLEINGSAEIHYAETGSLSEGTTTTYSASVTELTLKYEGVVLTVSLLRTEGNETRRNLNDNGFSHKSANHTGVSARLDNNGTNVLILDGFNADSTYRSNYSNDNEYYGYTMRFSGYIGSDSAGMFEVRTDSEIQGSEACPTEGKITFTGQNNQTLTVTFNGQNMTLYDGTETETVSCDD
jgi:hypothetical protein